MINLKQAVTAWHALHEAQVRPIDSQTEYEAMLEFLRELIRTQDVDHEPYKSLWATAALFAADWEKLHDPWLKEQNSSGVNSITQ
jgi:hypothetical protein